jgi:multiple sugar transport system permease protein
MTTESARYAQQAGSTAAAYPRPAGLSMQQREALAGYLFIAPDFLGLLLFIGVPMILALTMGFFNVNGFGAFAFVGFDNYSKMLIDPTFWQCLKVTATYVVVIVPALYLTGLGLALLVQRTNRFNTVMRAMFFAPQMVSLVVIAVVWQLMNQDKQGIIARAFAAIGVTNISLLGNPNFALYTVVFITVWFLMGFYMMIFLGGLQDIPREYYEAAEIDGAGRVHRFWHIARRCCGRVAGVRFDLRDDQGRSRQRDPGHRRLHLPAGLPVQCLRLRRGDGLDPGRHSAVGDRRSVHAHARRALLL